MPDEQGTLTESTGDSSQPVAVQSGDLISTVDMKMPPEEKSSEETQKTEATDGSDKGQEDKTKADDESKAKDKAEAEADEDTRFDKLPRFQELITGNQTLKAQIAQQQEMIEALQKATTEQKSEKQAPAYKDMGAMTVEELQEWHEDNPKEYAANLLMQARAEVREDVLSEVTQLLNAQKEEAQNKAIEGTYNEYASKHPDFDLMWDAGKIQAYIDEHPGHNAISAHMALTKESEMEAAIAEAVKKALKEAGTEASKNKEAKKNARVLDSGPSSTGHVVGQIPAELKDTKKFGGLTAVLAERSLRRSNQASQ